jgi:hypothetical protein
MNDKFRWMPVKVLDKRIKEGWFAGRSYYVTVRFLTSDEDPESTAVSITQPVTELKANIDNYYSMEIGSRQTIKMYEHRNGRLYTFPESEYPTS